MTKPSGEAMNGVYAALRELSPAQLRELFEAAIIDDTPASELLRYQIMFTAERRASGRW